MQRSKSLWFGVALLALMVGACDSTEAGTPALVSLSARTQTPPVGDTVQITARVLDGEDNTIADAKVSYKSSDASIASVTDGGLVKAIKEGTVIVTGTSGSADGNIGITVSPAPTTGGE